jgi:hypothetical protein
MPLFEGEVAIWVDFNEVFDEDYVWTSLRRTPSFESSHLQGGDWVRLADDDGATCLAIVREHNGPIIICKIDWSTWRSVRRPQLDGGGIVGNPSTSPTLGSTPSTWDVRVA